MEKKGAETKMSYGNLGDREDRNSNAFGIGSLLPGGLSNIKQKSMQGRMENSN